MRNPRWTLVIAAALLVSGCGAASATPDDTARGDDRQPPLAQGHDGHAAAPPTTPDVRTVEIAASSFAFSSPTVTLVAGRPVNVRLAVTDVAHDLTIDAAGFHLAADVGDARAAGLRIDDPGTYVAYCSVPGHREAGMELDIVVTGS